uniref:TM2 domain-containing protein n=1 Tax=Trichuris muris TaxID=70415 RepID=A0A5S6QIT3_TRIMR
MTNSPMPRQWDQKVGKPQWVPIPLVPQMQVSAPLSLGPVVALARFLLSMDSEVKNELVKSGRRRPTIRVSPFLQLSGRINHVRIVCDKQSIPQNLQTNIVLSVPTSAVGNLDTRARFSVPSLRTNLPWGVLLNNPKDLNAYGAELNRLCQTRNPCGELPASCLDCTFPPECSYGEKVVVTCRPRFNSTCTGETKVVRTTECRACFLVDPSYHICDPVFNCSVYAAPPNNMLPTLCHVNEWTICLGRRVFYKKVRCNWTSGYKRWKAITLSILAGGFGADRFYLGLWRSGLGKLFSFGGLGVWTLLDMILISLGYIVPADGSLYM